MSTNLENLVRLKNLTYGHVVQNLSHVSYGIYYFPTITDECTAINNEAAFESWKLGMLIRYPNAEIRFDSKTVWSMRIQLIDNSYQYERSISVRSKANFLNS